MYSFNVDGVHANFFHQFRGSYPWATITANVADPNQLDLGKASDGTEVTVPPSQGSVCIHLRY